MNIKEKWLNYYKSDDLAKWEIGIALGLLLFSFLFSKYVDLVALTRWTLDLVEVSASGNFFGFYEYAAQTTAKLPNFFFAMYGGDVFSILFWSVWNIPLWIIERRTGILLHESNLALLWSRMFLFVALLGCAVVAYKIIMNYSGNQKMARWAFGLTFMNVFVFLGVGIAGQNDIWVSLFAVLAIYCLFCDRKKLFYLFAALSIGVKPFFIFPYLAILLITEKNLLKIAGKALLGYSVALLFKLLFSSAPYYKESIAYGTSDLIFSRFFQQGIPVSFGVASFFLLALGALYVYLYLQPVILDKKERQYQIVFAIVITWLCMFAFVHHEWYRSILMIPFVPIMIGMNERKLSVNTIAYLLLNFVYTGVYFVSYASYEVLFGLNGSIAQKISGREFFPPLSSRKLVLDILNNAKTPFMITMANVFGALLLLIGVVVILINIKDSKFAPQLDNTLVKRWVIWITLLYPVILCVMFMVFTQILK